MNLIFYDVDTQNDFMEKKGRLYVPGAESVRRYLRHIKVVADELSWRAQNVKEDGLLPPLSSLAQICSEDYHSLTDPEISSSPDFLTTFPPHCMAGTKGQQRIAETQLKNPLYFNSSGIWYKGRKIAEDNITLGLKYHRGELVLRKQETDIANHKYADRIFDILKPDAAVVYGVATEFCVDKAVEYLLSRNIRTYVVKDAIKGISEAGERLTIQKWLKRGVGLLTTNELVAGSIDDLARMLSKGETK